MSAPLGYQPHHAAPADEPSPVDQMQAEVDAEQMAFEAAKRAETAALKDEVAKLQEQLASSRGQAPAMPPATLVAEPAADDDEQELLAAGCVKIALDLDDATETYVWVKPQSAWRMADFTAVATGNYIGWAQNCLATDDDVAEWMDANLDMGRLQAFFLRWREATGQEDPGKPQESRRLSRRTPRR
jgi:hypothetical protein